MLAEHLYFIRNFKNNSMTTIQELINEFENIKQTKCKTLQEVVFFDGVLAIIEAKYIQKERDQIMDAFVAGDERGTKEVPFNCDQYYSQLFLPLCYKDNKPCKYGCAGLCRESC